MEDTDTEEPGGELSVLDPEVVILVQLREYRTEVTDPVLTGKMRESMETGEGMMIEVTAAGKEVREIQEAIMMNVEEEKSKDAVRRMRMTEDLIEDTTEITEIDTEEIISNRSLEMNTEMIDIPSTEMTEAPSILVDRAPEPGPCLSTTTLAT